MSLKKSVSFSCIFSYPMLSGTLTVMSNGDTVKANFFLLLTIF